MTVHTQTVRTAGAVVRTFAVLSVAALVGGLTLHVLTPASQRGDLFNTPEPVFGPVAAVGGLVLLRQVPRDRVVLLVTTLGGFACLFTGAAAASFYGVATGRSDWLVFQVATWLAYWSWIPAFLGLVLVLPQVFPDGRCLSPRWRWLLWSAGALVALFCMAGAFSDVGEGSELPPNHAVLVSIPDFVVPLDVVTSIWLLLALLSLGLRFRRAGPVQRRQIAWLGYAVAVAALTSLLAPAPFNTLGSLAVPLAIGVAVTRYRLFDIDLVFNRTLVGVALLGCCALLYWAVVGWLGGLAGTRGTVVGFTGAVAVAAAFNPLYRGLQRGVDRLLHGRRDRYRVLTRSAAAIRDADSARQALDVVCGLLGRDLKLPAVAVRIPRPEGLDLVVGTPPEPTGATVLDLCWHGERVGVLSVARRRGNSPFDDADRTVLADVAAQLAAVAFAVRVSADLERSREQLLTSREEERRRMRRDLHDGLGPLLASAAMALDVAHRAQATRPERSGALVATARHQLQEAVADVRRLVDGLRPPALDDLGLAGALRVTGPGAIAADDSFRIAVECPDELGELPAAVEVAAYRIAQEAVTNAVRHSGGGSVLVRLARDAEGLTVSVVDDGVGIDPDAPRGIGLRSMAQRATELDGSIDVVGTPGGGTRVSVAFPLRERVGDAAR